MDDRRAHRIRRLSNSRFVAIALMALVGAYAAVWGILIGGTLLNVWSAPVFGIDLPSTVASLSLRELIQVYATVFSVIAGAAMSTFRLRAGWILFAIGTALHTSVWVERIGFPHYEGGPSFIFLGAGLLALALLYRHAFPRQDKQT